MNIMKYITIIKLEINFIESANEVGKDFLIIQKHALKNYNN